MKNRPKIAPIRCWRTATYPDGLACAPPADVASAASPAPADDCSLEVLAGPGALAAGAEPSDGTAPAAPSPDGAAPAAGSLAGAELVVALASPCDWPGLVAEPASVAAEACSPEPVDAEDEAALVEEADPSPPPRSIECTGTFKAAAAFPMSRRGSEPRKCSAPGETSSIPWLCARDSTRSPAASSEFSTLRAAFSRCSVPWRSSERPIPL